jgi:PhnB protein
MHVSPYLSFKGNCEQAFKFYEKVLGGKIEGIMTWGATPMAKEVPPDWQNKIIHARLVLDGQDVYGADAPPQYYQQPQGFSVSLGVKQVAEAERVFKALAENGTVKMPLQQTFWSAGFGMLIDRFGIPWQVNTEQAATQTA